MTIAAHSAGWLGRAVGVLLVLVLATSCFVGGTFAKYTTSGSGSDSARVAKFGVNVTADSGKMFSTTYEKHADDTFTVTGNTVVSQNADKLVAPGTSGQMANFNITGKPEVAVRVQFKVDEFKLENWTLDDGTVYCPIVFTVNGSNYRIDPADQSAAALTNFENEVKRAINDTVYDYAPGTDIAQELAKTDGSGNKYNLNISWKWPFESGSDQATNVQYDAKDTKLGDAAANGNPGKISLKITATVTQID